MKGQEGTSKDELMTTTGSHLKPCFGSSNAFWCTSDTAELFRCKHCEFETVLTISLHNHVNTFHKDQQANIDLKSILQCYQCENCKFQTYSLLVLFGHKCESEKAPKECFYQTRRERSLEGHINREDINWVKCEQRWRNNTTPKSVVKQENMCLISRNRNLGNSFRRNDSSRAHISEDGNTVEFRRKRMKLTYFKKVVPITEREYVNSHQPEDVTVDFAKKHEYNGKRVRDKGHACYFCGNIFGNMARHFEIKHSQKSEVTKILAMPKGSKQRRDAFAELLRIGDFQHNCNVLSLKSGELILVRRPSEKEKTLSRYSDYGPCPDCLGFMLKKYLWHHSRHGCSVKRRNEINFEEKDKLRQKIASESKALLNGLIAPEFSSEYNTHVVAKLRDDDVGKVCQKDRTILHFGYLQFEKYGTAQCESIRQQMRQIGRLLLEMQTTESFVKELSDCLTPQNFDMIVAATKALCEDTGSQFKIPSLALKIGHTLKKCIAFLRGQALKQGNLTTSRNCVRLQQLMKLDWSSRLSSQKRNISDLPVLEDGEEIMDELTNSNDVSDDIRQTDISQNKLMEDWPNDTEVIKDVVRQEEICIDFDNYEKISRENDQSQAKISQFSDNGNPVEHRKGVEKNYSSKETEDLLQSKIEENIQKSTIEKIHRHSLEKHLENSIFEEHEGQDVVTFDFAKKHENNGKRVRDKGHACYFCGNILGNMARHFEVKHSQESEVLKILAMPKGSKQRRDAFAELLRIGDFQHNCNVLSLKSGELILLRRPSEKEKTLFKYSDYGPCPNCFGFILKKHMWHHGKHGCLVKRKGNTNHEEKEQKIVSESKALVNGLITPEFSSGYIKHIVSKLRDDDIGKICQNDRTILNFGYIQFEKYGTTQSELIRQRMRQIGRLFLEIQVIKSDVKELSDCLIPQNFDIIVAATKALCATTVNEDSGSQLKIPPLALKIGHSLNKCITFLHGQALKQGNLRTSRDCVCLQRLMKLEWSSQISSHKLISSEKISILNLPTLEDANEATSEFKNHYDDTRKCDNNKLVKGNEKAFIQKKKVVKRRIVKTYWNQDEKDIVLNYFKTEIKNKVLPGKKKCEQCISEHAALQTRKWSDIKFYLKNFYTRSAKLIRSVDAVWF